MNTRLNLFMRSEELTAAKLAEILQVQPSSISHLLSGRNKPSFEFIARILRMFPDLSPDWIINGSGEMYRSKSTIDNNITNIDTLSYHSQINKENISDNQKINEVTNVTSVYCPDKVDSIKNGSNMISDDELSSQTSFSQNDNQFDNDNDSKGDDPIIVAHGSSNESAQIEILNHPLPNIGCTTPVNNSCNDEIQSFKNSSSLIEKVFVIYSDKTFEIYNQK